MKKVIKLTEKDLTRIIKRVIMEADTLPGGPNSQYPKEVQCVMNKVSSLKEIIDKTPECKTSMAADMSKTNLAKCAGVLLQNTPDAAIQITQCFSTALLNPMGGDSPLNRFPKITGGPF